MSIFKYLLPGALALGAALPAMARGDDGLRFVPQTGGRTGEVACVLDRRTGLLWERKTRSGLRARDHVYLPVDGRRGGEAGRCDAALPRCDAPSYVAAVNAARLCGHDDWRLPDEDELKSLLDLSRVATRPSRPAIDRRAFPDALPTFYWSSTLHRVGGVRAVWFDDTHRELPATSLLPTRAGAVRLVRGQPAVVPARRSGPSGAFLRPPAAAVGEDLAPSAAQLAQWRAQYARYRPGESWQPDWPPPQIDASVRDGFADLGLLPPVPFPADNPYSPQKVELGRRLFFDPQLSRNGQVSCASCHNPATGWTDRRAVSLGHLGQRGERNSMSILNSAYATSLFWDGRAGSLEAQALGPISNPLEMHQPLARAVARIAAQPGYAPLFAAAFGDARVDTLRMARALATFERTLISHDSAFDRFLKGERMALDDRALWGLHLYRTKARCINCHNGALLSDNRFHSNGLHYFGRELEDLGRYAVTGDPADRGKFRTPSLRDILLTGPYMHNGLFPLTENLGVIAMYDAGMVQTAASRPDLPQAAPELRPLGLTLREKQALHAFLQAVSGEARTGPATPAEMGLEPVPARR